MKRSETKETNKAETATLFEINEAAGNVLNFSSTLKELSNSVDANLIKQKPARIDRNGQPHKVEYVEWHTVADILDEHAADWGHSIKDIRPIGDIVTVTVAITINGVTREGIGTGRASSETGIKKAEHDALKRAAVKFGIARELYKKETVADEPEAEEQPKAAVNGSERRFEDSIAMSRGEMLTAKQLGMIRSIARDVEIDVARECANVMKCSVTELSKRAASEFIDHLQQLQRDNAAAMRRAG